MTDIVKNIREIRSTLPSAVRLVAVSKFHPVESIRLAYDGGQRIFGESRAQELVEKAAVMPEDVDWHFIGHLQTNKVRTVVPIVRMIESVDSVKLLYKINEEAERIGKVVDVLLELHVAKEETKSGFLPEELDTFFACEGFADCHNVRICGVMGMATNTEDELQVRDDFRNIKQVFDRLKSGFMSGNDFFREISMGMSDDYLLAIKEGSTMVRIGSHIFGARQY